MGPGRLQARYIQMRCAHFHLAAPIDLVRQGAAPVADDGARDRSEQRPVFVRYMLRRAHENATRPIDDVRFDARGNQPHDLFLEHLPVPAAVLIPDHQIRHQTLKAPVGVSLHQLAYQVDIGRVANLQQHNRQIAGNGVAPQAGLPAAFLQEDARVGAKRRIGVDDGIGQACIEVRVGFGRVDLAQDHLIMGPCQFEDAIREPPILVFLDQAQGCVAGFADAGNHIDRCRLFRIERDAGADGDNRVQHRALTARQGRAIDRRARRGERPGSGDRVSAADELHAVRLIGDLAPIRAVHGHEVKHPRRLLGERARPARAKDSVPLRDDLGLNKKVAERRMQRVRGRCGENHFSVAGDLDRAT